jgi:hypothetical protein
MRARLRIAILREFPFMRLWNSSLRFAIMALGATVCLVGAQQVKRDDNGFSQVRADDSAVTLPTAGTIDERPFFSSRQHPVIAYSERESTDIAGELSRRVEAGTERLPFDKTSGYLPAVLEALHIPTESQSLVFSKTSLQAHFITPSNPRAIYYSDNASVAFIRNASLLEISALDPQLGPVFYLVEQVPAERPRIFRSDSCLSCHETRASLGTPGLLARSMAVGTGGETRPQFGNYLSDHRSPFEQRWGGWFITGKTSTARHMGNVMMAENGQSVTNTKPLDSLEGKFDLAGYPSNYSDVAAVMVFNHQVGMTNLLTRVGWETRIALDRRSKYPQEKETADRLIAADARELADYILFADEALLPGKFESTSGFQAKFESAGPRDKRGRSFRQLDLTKRLFRYPCSYLIYSPTFDALPGAVKDIVYTRLWEILSGKDKAPKYSKLSAADRTAVVSILLETKPNLPSYFQPLSR